MTIMKIYAHISCGDLAASEGWYRQLFGRGADKHPMAGLAEWHFSDSAGLQLFEDKKNAGSSTLTIGVDNLQDEHARLAGEGLRPGAIEEAHEVGIARLRDPDGNLVVFAGPK